ncbi:MAG: type VI secretion system lipoprotein TssJ [Syntrophaceae bacterium]
MKKVCTGSLLVAVLVCACATTGKHQEPVSIWTYEKDAITLNFKTDKKLNLRNKKPHTLLVCVYQLKDPTAFNLLTRDQSGLKELLECELIDLSMVASKRIIVNPGNDVDMKLDRAEGARYVGVVAGYYTVEKGQIVRLYEIPALPEKRLFWKTKTLKPRSILINLILGASQLQDPKTTP